MKTLLENAFNRYLNLDPESKRRIAALDNKVVAIELLGIGITFQLVFALERVNIEWEPVLVPDITIKGTPINLIHMKLAPEQRKRFFAEDVIVEGNMEMAQQVLAIFDDLEIDWEEWLSEFIGDVPAYQIGRIARGMREFSQRLRQTTTRNVNEYVHEEINLFPAREALQDFFQDVDELRMEVDRLEARIARLIDLAKEGEV